MDEVRERIDGVAIGMLLGFVDGRPLVVFAGNPQAAGVPARSLAPLGPDALGAEVALLFEEGDPGRPLIVGRIVRPGEPVERARPAAQVSIVGEERIELRCGAATILMEKDGRIVIRGAHVVSHASGANRVRGGSVHLN
jgi:hypothetical protein